MGLSKEQYEKRLKQVENPLEHDEQVKVIQWCDGPDSPDEAALIFAIPNGGYRGDGKMAKIVGERLKAEGLRKGIPDLFLPVPMSGFNGLFVEMKRLKDSSVSHSQKKKIPELKKQGYQVDIARGHEEAIQIIDKYLRPF